MFLLFDINYITFLAIENNTNKQLIKLNLYIDIIPCVLETFGKGERFQVIIFLYATELY